MMRGKGSMQASNLIRRSHKNDIVAESAHPVTLVTGLANDAMGYATDGETAAKSGYAQEQVPLMGAALGYADAHDELRAEMAALAQNLGSA